MNAREQKIEALAVRAALLLRQLKELKEKLGVERATLDGLLGNGEVLQFGCLRVQKSHVNDSWVERHFREGGWQVRISKVKEKAK